MDIKIESRHLEDIVVLVPDVFQDERVAFLWRRIARTSSETMVCPIILYKTIIPAPLEVSFAGYTFSGTPRWAS